MTHAPLPKRCYDSFNKQSEQFLLFEKQFSIKIIFCRLPNKSHQIFKFSFVLVDKEYFWTMEYSLKTKLFFELFIFHIETSVQQLTPRIYSCCPKSLGNNLCLSRHFLVCEWWCLKDHSWLKNIQICNTELKFLLSSLLRSVGLIIHRFSCSWKVLFFDTFFLSFF